MTVTEGSERPVELVCCSHVRPRAEQGVIELKDAGATAIELFLGFAPHVDVRQPAEVALLEQALQRSDLRVFSAHLSFGPETDLSCLDDAQRRDVIRRLWLEMEVASALGAEKVIVHPGESLPEYAPRDRHLAAAAKGMAAIIQRAEDLELDVAFENLPPGYLGGGLQELLVLVDGLGSARAGFCLDTGHVHLGRETSLVEMVRAFAGRIHVLHWHDNDGQQDRHWIPGAGTIDWPAFFAALDEIGFDGPVTAECSPPEPLALAEFVRLGQLALHERRAMYV